jgi:hypothetical protein
MLVPVAAGTKRGLAMRLAIVLLACLLSVPSVAAVDQADPLVKKHLDSLKLKYEIDEDKDFKIVMDVGEGRTQLAYVRSSTESYGVNRVREIWSPGYKSETEELPQKVANRLLDYSNDVKMGGWVKQKRVAVFVVKISANASATELKDAIDAAVNSADEIEQEYTGKKDEF